MLPFIFARVLTVAYPQCFSLFCQFCFNYLCQTQILSWGVTLCQDKNFLSLPHGSKSTTTGQANHRVLQATQPCGFAYELYLFTYSNMCNAIVGSQSSTHKHFDKRIINKIKSWDAHSPLTGQQGLASPLLALVFNPSLCNSDHICTRHLRLCTH